MNDNQLKFTDSDNDFRIASSENRDFVLRFDEDSEHTITHYLTPAFYWEPREDITAYELAMCLPHLFGPITQSVIESLPDGVKRHFKPV